MKSKYISPVQIPHLVRLTADLFNTLNKEIQVAHASPQKAIQVNFVVDLLKDFTDTAYPIEKGNIKNDEMARNRLIKVGESKSFDEMMEAVAEIAKDIKPPKVGEF